MNLSYLGSWFKRDIELVRSHDAYDSCVTVGVPYPWDRLNIAVRAWDRYLHTPVINFRLLYSDNGQPCAISL